jgi:uncharacterized protein YbjQ (UPF0145 family)
MTGKRVDFSPAEGIPYLRRQMPNHDSITGKQGGNTMLLLSLDYIPGKKIQALGLVKGSVVQSKHFGNDFMAGMKTLVGGEIKGYTDMLSQARQMATDRMASEAGALGADAVLAIRYTSSAVMQGAAEVTAYGTAVKILGDE